MCNNVQREKMHNIINNKHNEPKYGCFSTFKEMTTGAQTLFDTMKLFNKLSVFAQMLLK